MNNSMKVCNTKEAGYKKEKQNFAIGIIVTWFGILPDYFSAWLISAEANKCIDFLLFTDCDIESKADNIKIHNISMEGTIALFEKKLDRKIIINNSYKFCDCRPFFGILFEDYLKDYDFWGYCDIDLMFGDIRHFLTDDVLRKYDRFYQYGHLSIFRNNYEMCHLYDLPGGLFSQDEIFLGEVKTTPEEYFGINNICEVNKIRWYTKVDFADFRVAYKDRLECVHGKNNYHNQIFYWKDGCAYRRYEERGVMKDEEFVYIHWQKRKPLLWGQISDKNAIIVTPARLISEISLDDITIEYMQQLNPDISKIKRKIYKYKYLEYKIINFIKSSYKVKRVWIRQKIFKLTTTRSYQ